MVPVLEVRNVRVTRGTTRILRGIDWTVGAGQHWALLGPNGSGKTSLLRVLMGYLAPTDGEIRVLGRTYGRTDWRDLRLSVGIVTSAFASSIPGAETALETVISGRFAQFDLWARVTPTHKREARRLLAWAGIRHLATRPWEFLSQGERQRVLIARALMNRPRLLLLDEPCAGLDPVARERLLAFIGRLGRRRSGPALVLVTHHVEEILPEFAKVLLLRNGSVVAAGATRHTLNSSALSRTFGKLLLLRRSAGRYRLEWNTDESTR